MLGIHWKHISESSENVRNVRMKLLIIMKIFASFRSFCSLSALRRTLTITIVKVREKNFEVQTRKNYLENKFYKCRKFYIILAGFKSRIRFPCLQAKKKDCSLTSTPFLNSLSFLNSVFSLFWTLRS